MAHRKSSTSAVLDRPTPVAEDLPPEETLPPEDLPTQLPAEDDVILDEGLAGQQPEINPFAITQASFASPQAGDTGTHLRNPLMIGNPGEAGAVLLNKRGYFAASIGNFSGVLVKFPRTSVLLKIYVTVLTTFNGVTPTLNFGKTAAGAEFGTTLLSGAPATIELPITALVYPTYSLFMSATGLSTLGECIICMVYSGTPLKTWQ